MNLLFERRQKPGTVTLVPLQFGGGPLFTLWAKAEFTEDEYALLQKYRFNDALLIADDWLAMLQRSFRTAVMLGFVAWWLLFAFFSWSVSTSLAVLLVLILTAVYYNELREHIYVRDLVHGRVFRCFSIVELVQKEEYLKGITAYLRQVLETAKHWDGREVVPVPTLTPQEAKALVAKVG